MGHDTNARRLLDDALACYRRVVGEEHPETLRTAVILSSVLLALGETTRAEELRGEVSNIRSQHGK
jgi:hypothetical protein